jgi:hypothetical protein
LILSDLPASPEVSLPNLSQVELAGTLSKIKFLNSNFKHPSQATYPQSSAKAGDPVQSTDGGPDQAPHQGGAGALGWGQPPVPTSQVHQPVPPHPQSLTREEDSLQSMDGGPGQGLYHGGAGAQGWGQPPVPSHQVQPPRPTWGAKTQADTHEVIQDITQYCPVPPATG